MNKLYLRLHNAISNFKKQFLSIGLLLFLLLHAGIRTNAQCNNTNASGSVTAPSSGNTVQINACAFAGDYSTINSVAASTSYTVTSSNATDFFTIRQGTPGGAVVAYGVTPLTWTPTMAGTYYVHVTLQYACATQASCRTTSITNNGSCGAPPVITVTPNNTCGSFCNLVTATGADTYTWFPYTGLFLDCTQTVPYMGGNASHIYADPRFYTTYTVTGKNNTTGCTGTTIAGFNNTPPAPMITPPSVAMCLGNPAEKLRVTSTGTQQFCSGPLNINVPDNNVAGVSNSIIVSGMPNCQVFSMSVTINMTHTRVGDMVFVLKAPNGQVFNLDYYLSATGSNAGTTGFVNTIISSNALNALNTGTNPFTATFKPDAQVSNFGYGPTGPTGMVPTNSNWYTLFSVLNGTWTLGMYDGRGSETGTLNSWCLGITTTCGTTGPVLGGPSTWSPIAGLFTDAGASFAYTGAAVDSVWVKPATSGTFTYQVVTPSSPVAPRSFTNTNPITIPVGGAASPYPSDVFVSGLPSTGISVKSVILNGVTHTSSEDIDIILQSPTGQNVMLMSDVGGTTAIPGNIFTFEDSGPAMSITGANASGTYKPTNNGVPDNFPAPGPGNVSQAAPAIAMFTGNYNGLWKLFVVDDDGTASQGSIPGGFTIVFQISPTNCYSQPRTVVVTVGQPITITAQPVNKTVCTTLSAYFSVTVSTSGTPTYQWQESTNGGATYTNITDGGLYSGTATSALTIFAPPLSMSGNYYRVVINNGSGPCTTVISAGAMLTISLPPAVVISANPLIIGPAQTTTIFSTVTPNQVASYAWYYNNSFLPGNGSPNLVVSYGSPGDYQLKVIDVNGCNKSSNIITIANSFALNMVTYPNPNGGIFQVIYHHDANNTTNNTLQRSLIVYNNWGEKIITKSFTQTIPVQKIDVDVRAHGKGVYWVELRDANGTRLGMNRVVVQ